MIKKLHIQDFRGFENLQLENLSRVNLIVGRNNTGKTSLLEALAIVCGRDEKTLAGQLPGLFRQSYGDIGKNFFRWLVRDESRSGTAKLSADLDSPRTALGDIEVQFTPNRDSESDEWKSLGVSPMLFMKHRARVKLVAKGEIEGQAAGKPLISARSGKQAATMYPPTFRVLSDVPRRHDDLIKSFADAVRSEAGEQQVERILAQVDPRISRARLDQVDGRAQIMLGVGLSESVPLSQLGQGVARLVAMLSVLIGEWPLVCFIDEIENGIHHSALRDIWTGLAEVCAQLDIQLFATTHSHECIEAAHAAMSARDKYDFSVIQLVRASDGIKGYVRDRKDIEAALAGEIDLR